MRALVHPQSDRLPPDPYMNAQSRMQAALFEGPRGIRIGDVELPQPEPDQVRVRMEGCGLCASNLGPWIGGPWFSYPLPSGSPGHEGWGRVDALGADVQGFSIGERVAVLSQNAYAQYDVAPASALVRLPPEFDDLPFPGEPLGCAMNIFRRSRVRADQTVAIVGVGFLGALLVSLCAAQGARVIAVSRRPFAREIARQCGAEICLATEDLAAVRDDISELTRGLGCERVIEAVGMQWALDLASQITATRGRLVIAGYHQDGPRQVDMQQWNWRGIDVINAHERDQEIYIEGMREAVAAIQGKRMDPFSLCTHRFNLRQLPEAFEMLQQRPEGFLKAWIAL